MRNRYLLVAAIVLFAALPAFTAVLTAPPSGNNQRAAVTQFIGPVKINIDYSSPRVHNPYTGEDRRGKIWGTLVPYGLFRNNDGYGTCKDCPWRAGARVEHGRGEYTPRPSILDSDQGYNLPWQRK